MGLMDVGVMHAVRWHVLRKKQCPYSVLFIIMELLPGGIVAGGRKAHSPVEVHFKAKSWGILGALEAEKWKALCNDGNIITKESENKLQQGAGSETSTSHSRF